MPVVQKEHPQKDTKGQKVRERLFEDRSAIEKIAATKAQQISQLLLEADKSVRKIAFRVGCSEAYVYKLRKRLSMKAGGR